VANLILTKKMRRRIDASPLLRRARWALEAATLAVMWGIAAILPLDLASALGQRIGRAIGPRLVYKHHVRRNLEIAFPEASKSQIETWERDVWGNVGATFAEYPHLGRICRPGPSGRIQVVFESDGLEDLVRRRPTMFMACHLANWELPGGVAAIVNMPLSAVYAPQENRYAERLLYGHRRKLGCRLISRDDSPTWLARAMQAGETVGLLVDNRHDEGVDIPFFGHDRPSLVSPARLAVRYDVAVVPVRTERLGGANFRITVHNPIAIDDGPGDNRAKAKRLMCRVNETFEQWIRERPEDWFCLKRGWPKKLLPNLGDKDPSHGAYPPSGKDCGDLGPYRRDLEQTRIPLLFTQPNLSQGR
jgi:KDO2-lipid IV(A) lauroyltransferase